jgi:predicted metal-binding membrane protein
VTAQRAFVGIAALLACCCAAVTILWCQRMTAMGGMSMPGGWTMSMAWMRLPGQSLPGAASSYLAMWIAMMIAMMSPAILPLLARHRLAMAARGETRPGWLASVLGVGYLLVWAVVGLATYAIGLVLATAGMAWPRMAGAAPVAAAVVLLVAGALQCSAWKSRQLDCCRQLPAGHCTPATGFAAALRAGMRLGVQCAGCCTGLTAALLVLGVMDLRVMAGVTVATTIERLAPAHRPAARAVGAALVVAGVLLLARVAVGG